MVEIVGEWEEACTHARKEGRKFILPMGERDGGD